VRHDGVLLPAFHMDTTFAATCTATGGLSVTAYFDCTTCSMLDGQCTQCMADAVMLQAGCQRTRELCTCALFFNTTQF